VRCAAVLFTSSFTGLWLELIFIHSPIYPDIIKSDVLG
jgi:hypothetical protein